MNVLVLTPDRVGSTLLQRLLTIYANINDTNKLTVNLHELTNGLVRYHNSFYGRDMLGKRDGGWGYHQKLSEIVNLVDTAGHDVTARLAHYHIKNRKDSLTDQLSFYEYLNKNFFIIAARRHNVFEHGLSWCIYTESKKLNVYSFEEKYNTYKNIHDHKMAVDPSVLTSYLQKYDEYLQWVDAHFHVNAYFDYEDDMPRIEDYVLSLNVFNDIKTKLTWEDYFNISWSDWNRMHYLLSLVPFDHKFTTEEDDFMVANTNRYTAARVKIQDMQDAGMLVGGVPIKLHSLAEKASVINNVDKCLLAYNQWVNDASVGYALSYTPQEVVTQALIETPLWRLGDATNQLTNSNIPKQVFLTADLKRDQK